ncbi:AAA family ATPase [Providencia rustigianii]|uniref:AAA family ATPase n=1 Tax=Providencia rustigianii TaxID=158850 RepID=UPI00223F7038|nr:ATP-binding protein [Providencia rustigianii]
MAITITYGILRNATHEELLNKAYSNASNAQEVDIDVDKLSEEAVSDLRQTCDQMGQKKIVRVIDSIVAAKKGDFSKPVASFQAFDSVLIEYLRRDAKDGWIYRRGSDGNLYAALVTSVKHNTSGSYRNQPPSVDINISWYGFGDNSNRDKPYAVHTGSIKFYAQEVARRHVSKILAEQSLFKETPELRAEYDEQLERYHELVQGQFPHQFRAIGAANKMDGYGSYDRNLNIAGHKLIHDLPTSECGPISEVVETDLLGTDEVDGFGVLPEATAVRFFDLSLHQYVWVHSNNVEPYLYDKNLRNKMILPESHSDLLDVLTTDITAFTSDIIEGKSAGNIIMCVGKPGLGKTLTAEVYSELTERALYSIHAGTLGINAEEIDKNLKTILMRARRWDCVLLLDEADVFVMARGLDMVHNAVVAEFLRTMEYFDGLMFMTSNRENDLDEAIIPRCAAIIRYDVPTIDDAKKIWQVMADNFGVELSADLLNQLVDRFPTMPPRDIKMLLRLTLRMCRAKHGDGAIPDIEMFRRCAMFRGVQIRSKNERQQDDAA